MLVESGIREIEKMQLGTDIFVQAKKAGLTLYQKVGFKLVDSSIQDGSSFGVKDEYSAYFLIRKTS
jgi:hypothetical protein